MKVETSKSMILLMYRGAPEYIIYIHPYEKFERDGSEIQARQMSETWTKIEHGDNERDTAVRKRDNLNKNWAGHLSRRDIFMACLWPDYCLIFYGGMVENAGSG